MRKIVLLAATAALLASTPAFARESICIRQDDIRNWSSPDDKHLVLENYHHQKALLTLIGTCSGFKFTETIAIRSPGGTDLSCIERGDTVRTHDLGFRGSCAVVNIEPYNGPVGSHHDDHAADHHDDHGNDHHGDSY